MRPKITRLAVAALAVLAVATDPPSAHASTGADRIVGRLAGHQVQGWIDNSTPAPVLQRRIDQGGRIYVTCSVIADLAVQAARKHRIPARHVSVLTNGRFDGYNDGHAMLELKLGGHWVLYDPDMNRVAVDRDGRRIGLSQQMKAGSDRQWRMIAHDSERWNLSGLDSGTLAAVRRLQGVSADAWYTHVMGVALVETSPGQYAYHGTGRRSPRVENVWPGHYTWVNATTWRSLNA